MSDALIAGCVMSAVAITSFIMGMHTAHQMLRGRSPISIPKLASRVKVTGGEDVAKVDPAKYKL